MRFPAVPFVASCAVAACAPAPVEDPQDFSLCAAPTGGWVDQAVVWQGLEVSLDGPVTAAGDATAPASCDTTTALRSDGGLGQHGWWFRVDDADGLSWTVDIDLPGATPPEVGDTVHVIYGYEFGGFGPTVTELTVRDAENALIAWVGVGGALGDLHPPDGLAVAEGPVVERVDDSCGAWARYALTVDAGGASADLPYGGSAEVGGLEVRHGGYEQTTRAGTCLDWFVAHVALAALPAP